MNHSKLTAPVNIVNQSPPRNAERDLFSVASASPDSSFSPDKNDGFLGNITKLRDNAINRRLERWAMQSAARDILPSERVSKCLRSISVFKHPDPSRVDRVFDLDYFRNVEILKSKENFHYGNLMTCGSVWHCPICAAKISEQRRSELTTAVSNWKKQGGNVLLLTLTVPHYAHQGIKPTLDGLSDALRRLTFSRGWRSLSKEIGLYGRIRSLETTYGLNGWHPHFHLLLFIYNPVDIVNLQTLILPLWKSACLRSGLAEPNHHGVRVDNGVMAAKYVGKWGLEHEMTKGHIKKSNKGYSPFDLLRVYLGQSESGFFLDQDTRLAGKLFREYAAAFKGKKQLLWSRGLRDSLLLDLVDLTDQEVADKVEPDAELFALIPLATWKIVLQRRLRGVLLEKCRLGKETLNDYLLSLLIQPSSGVHRDPHV